MSEQEAKPEYSEWKALLTKHLGLKGIAYVLTQADTTRYRPQSPGDEPANAADRREWLKLEASYRKELRNFHAAFDQAIGVLRASFKYGSKAYNDVEASLSTITQGIFEADWTPELRFRAAYTMLNERYCPRDSTDVNTLRRTIQEITDINSGGFNKYSAEFTRIHLILKDTPFPPTSTELAEWARKSILNMEVKKHLTTTVLRDPNSPTYEIIFQEVRTFLKNMGDECDPYCTTKSGPTSKPLVAARIDIEPTSPNTPKPTKCTRCWRQGHHWKDCRAQTCSSCGKSIVGQKICPNWMNHTMPGTNWAPKHLAKPVPSSPSVSMTSQLPTQAVTPSHTGNPVSDEIKRTRKALNTLIKQAKKQKTDG